MSLQQISSFKQQILRTVGLNIAGQRKQNSAAGLWTDQDDCSITVMHCLCLWSLWSSVFIFIPLIGPTTSHPFPGLTAAVGQTVYIIVRACVCVCKLALSLTMNRLCYLVFDLLTCLVSESHSGTVFHTEASSLSVFPLTVCFCVVWPSQLPVELTHN